MDYTRASVLRSSIISIALLLIPVFTWGLWIYISRAHRDLPHSEKVHAFNSYLPAFAGSYLSVIVLIAAAASVVFAIAALRRSASRLKLVNIITLVLAFLFLALQVFSMM